MRWCGRIVIALKRPKWNWKLDLARIYFMQLRIIVISQNSVRFLTITRAIKRFLFSCSFSLCTFRFIGNSI
ncbi:hypothetical protein AL705_03855 [Lawsonella clevelandensis]|uniref:Uncharacterized protein n=1 Tax=Lawsonella clevelandensis TaxID=1528099 RepID=A0A0M3TBN4_9ACTN|nr:hypothetical protein AL705_03855 [Lawsonella clevelandensis]